MEEPFVLCAYYTDSYADVANNFLIKSFEGVPKLEHCVLRVPSGGTWQANTSFKPTFAKMMLNRWPKRNVVLVDVDATINSFPELFFQIPKEYNIAAHVLDRQIWYNKSYPPLTRFHLLTGTLFLRNNEKTEELVNAWQARCKEVKFWEQQVLQDVLREKGEGVFGLPISYCWIASLPNGQVPYAVCENPVVTHFQASREMRKLGAL